MDENIATLFIDQNRDKFRFKSTIVKEANEVLPLASNMTISPVKNRNRIKSWFIDVISLKK